MRARLLEDAEGSAHGGGDLPGAAACAAGRRRRARLGAAAAAGGALAHAVHLNVHTAPEDRLLERYLQIVPPVVARLRPAALPATTPAHPPSPSAHRQHAITAKPDVSPIQRLPLGTPQPLSSDVSD